MTFLLPALAWFGIAAAAIPIIIHLLNRRRFTRVDWAPMKYLKLTIQSNKRRLQIEQLILLAMRVLAMLLLFATVARPMISRGGFGTWLAGKQRKSQVIVIDDSMSMSQSLTDGGEVFGKAKSAAIEIVRRANAADQLTVFIVSNPNAPLVRQAQIDDAGDLVRAITDLKTSHLMNQWASTFEAVDEYFEGAAYPTREVVLITDLRAAGWNADIAKRTEAWADGDTSVTIVDVGRQLESNMLIEGLQQVSPIALAGSSTDFVATIRNESNEQAADLQATLFVNGTPQTIAIPPVGANATIDVPLRLDFPDPGTQRIRLELPNDLMREDNSRFLVVDVRPSISIVMVDGDPRATAFQSETDFLAASCRAGRAPWQVDVVQSLAEVSFEVPPDVLVLANVGTIDGDFAAIVEKHVRNGMGLIVYAGELVDPDSYNNLLFKNGAGILPSKLKETAQDEFTGMVIEPLGESPIDILTRLSASVLGRIKPNTIYRVESSEHPDTRVLATWKGADPSPALLEKRFGDGRVFLWTITADRGWTDWPQEPSFVLAVRQTVQFAASQALNRANVVAGQPLQTKLGITETPTDAKAAVPGVDEEVELTVESASDGPLMAFEDTSRAGFYQFAWTDRAGQREADDFAVSVDGRESDGTRLAEEELEKFLGNVDWRLMSIGADETGVGDQAELWRTGAMIFLGLIGCESLFAAWIGRER